MCVSLKVLDLVCLAVCSVACGKLSLVTYLKAAVASM